MMKYSVAKREVENKLKGLPMFSSLNKSVRDYIFAQSKVEMYRAGEEIPMQDPNVSIDFIYVLQGGVEFLMDNIPLFIAKES